MPVSSPTIATLAVTALRVSNSGTSHATYEATLFQSKLLGKSCDPGTIERFYSDDTLRPDDEREQQYPAPLIIKPTGVGVGYCLVVALSLIGGTPGPSDFLGVQFAGYVAAGSYNGLGTSAPNRASALPTPGVPQRR